MLSIRTGCGGSTELTCTSMAEQGTSNFSLTWNFDPGVYFIVVDQNDVLGGSYKLDVAS
ncbi:hypothetical protein [Nannocystis pusilla]|uniref:hypothetical protein n=1 Tax=Nannocystis pusilla TaxID=889268 RepID=UPI003DA4C566